MNALPFEAMSGIVGRVTKPGPLPRHPRAMAADVSVIDLRNLLVQG